MTEFMRPQINKVHRRVVVIKPREKGNNSCAQAFLSLREGKEKHYAYRRGSFPPHGKIWRGYGLIINREVNGPEIMEENAGTIICLIPFFDSLLKISPFV